MRLKRWAVFISGMGSNLNALLDVRSQVDIALVVSSSAQAPGISRARRAGAPVLILDKKVDWSQLRQTLKVYQIEALFLAGFMKIIPHDFLSKFRGECYNLHPSLLPSYQGLDSISRAFNDKSELGCTVHKVIAQVDAGEIRLQRTSRRAKDLSQTELLIHIAEQNCVRDAVVRC